MNKGRVEKVYLTTWLQRTSLHLKEIYNFVALGQSLPGLDLQKVTQYRRNLEFKSAEFGECLGLENLKLFCDGAEITVTEDGVVMITHAASLSDFNKERAYLYDFYDRRLGPSLSYLFSRGAPLPRELVHSGDFYPLLVLTTDFNLEDAKKFLESEGDVLINSNQGKEVDFFVGKKISLLNHRRDPFWKGLEASQLVMNVEFILEFENQLHDYLNLHRTIWEEIDRIREFRSLRYRDFPKVREKLLAVYKNLSFVSARLAQMKDLSEARRLAIDSKVMTVLKDIGMERFDHMKSDQEYITHLWTMTKDYASGTMELLEFLYEENTQKELTALKYITLVGAVTSFFGMNIAFPWDDTWDLKLGYSLEVVALIFIILTGFYYYLKFLVYNRKFSIKES